MIKLKTGHIFSDRPDVRAITPISNNWYKIIGEGFEIEIGPLWDKSGKIDYLIEDNLLSDIPRYELGFLKQEIEVLEQKANGTYSYPEVNTPLLEKYGEILVEARKKYVLSCWQEAVDTFLGDDEF